MAVGGNIALAGCLSVGPSVETDGLKNSLVFADVAPAETVSVGGNRFTVRVQLKPTAFERLDVTRIVVWAANARPFSSSQAETIAGPIKTQSTVTIQLPAGDPAVISALNEKGTAVESIRVTNDATEVLAWLGSRPQPVDRTITQLTMPAKILTAGFEKKGTQFSTNAWMNGKIKNTAQDAEIPYLAVEAVFRNDGGKVVDRSVESIEGLSPGEVWDAVVPVYGDASRATTGKLTIAESNPGKNAIPPTNVTLLEERLEQPEEGLEPPKVVGKVKNTGTAELDFLEASAKFYAENGDVFDDNAASVTGLGPGKTWKFEIPFYAHSTERAERVAEYALSLVA